MGQLSAIGVTCCDNELYILAINPNSSIELAHLQGGAPMGPMSITGTLSPGSWTIQIIGINWGGPAAFSVYLIIDGQSVPYSYSNQSTPVGVVWTDTVAVTV